MFAKKSTIKEAILRAREEEKAHWATIHQQKMRDLEDRLRGEFEVLLKEKEAEVEIRTRELSDARNFIKDAEEVYLYCWDKVKKTEQIGTALEMHSERIKKYMGYIHQSIHCIVDETQKNKNDMLSNDETNRKKLKMVK